MEFQWYEFELVEKKDQWTHITDWQDRKLQDHVYHLRKDAVSFIENQIENRCYIACTVNRKYRMTIKRLASGLYFCSTVNFDEENDSKLPWAIVKIRKHIAKVPMNIVDEYFENTYKRTGEK